MRTYVMSGLAFDSCAKVFAALVLSGQISGSGTLRQWESY